MSPTPSQDATTPAGAPAGVVVRPAVAADAGEVLTVQRAAFVAEAQRYGDPSLPPLREDLAAVRAAIAADDVVCLVAVRGPRLVGAVRLRVDGALGHVGRLAVAPDQERQGIGTRLLAAVESAAPQAVTEFRLFTGGDSDANVARYERAGYVRTGTSVDDRGVPLAHLAKQR
ncbi:GNAT family N-acetyltransferase [Kineococcus rubinsiae]|uniref:GNAT family N-acetyltransferase n=1 Tax=Kineococcus rubinsiae TaxID=2609562 RepID=UPI00142FCE2C|nr:GNAT family N-acetyltransferase [Kineococcus rubinsiae]NIZ91445.1 GNAT family N-acetyltransferase [Kineococcus rubinsiae]